MRYQEFAESSMCPECGGPSFSNLLLAEKQDACYHKVKSRYKVWPSAYASGALVQCRKKGAANWGNKSEGVAEMDSQQPTGRIKPDGTRSHSTYGSRDHYNLGDPETTLGPDSVLTAKDVAKKASQTLDKAFDKSHKKGVAEGLNEFAPPGSNDGGDDGFSEETLKRLAAQWYNGDEDPRVERTLMAAGWEIGQDEGYDDEPGVFVVQAGDINGNSYISWPAHELKQGVAEGSPQSMGTALANALSRVEPGSKLDKKIRHHNDMVRRFGPEAGTMTSAPDGYHIDKKGFVRLGQGVAEGTGNGYYYLQGGIERSKKFASEAEAMAHSKRFFQLARVRRVTLKYKEPGQPAVVVKEFTFNDPEPPKSQMSWGDFYLQNKKQGMSEDAIAEMKNLAGLK